ncbi:MAG: outer membrane beta-barrel protein [Capsulimonadales bacterium]|nr:outer membrane beta-barrel protein [Capsulimonadales bacterium]
MKMKFLVAAAVAGLVVVASEQARAQDPVRPALPVDRPWRVKLGAFFPTNGDLTDVFGKTFFSYGASYDFGKTTAVNPIVYSGYFDGTTRSRSGARITYYSLGAQGRYYFNPVVDPVRTYAGGGLGIYLLNSTGSGDTDNDFRLGGKLLGGLEFNNGFFAEADYTLIGSVRGTTPNGFNVALGYRF